LVALHPKADVYAQSEIYLMTRLSTCPLCCASAPDFEINLTRLDAAQNAFATYRPKADMNRAWVGNINVAVISQ
jgi:hypothetical protein